DGGRTAPPGRRTRGLAVLGAGRVGVPPPHPHPRSTRWWPAGRPTPPADRRPARPAPPTGARHDQPDRRRPPGCPPDRPRRVPDGLPLDGRHLPPGGAEAAETASLRRGVYTVALKAGV